MTLYDSQNPPPGRPPNPKEITFKDLSEDEKILFLYRQGCSDHVVCRGLQINKKEFDLRYKNEDRFRLIIDFGRTISQAWWEELGRLGKAIVRNEGGDQEEIKINAPVYNFQMKNRFGWAEKSETTNNDLLSVENKTKEELEIEFQRIAPKLLDFSVGAQKVKG